MASVGFQGAFATHRDCRDTRTTLRASMRYGGLAFPAYGHLIKLGPGDVVAFNGKRNYHANVVFPTDAREARYLPRELQNLIGCLYFQKQQDSYITNYHNTLHPEDAVSPVKDYAEASAAAGRDDDSEDGDYCDSRSASDSSGDDEVEIESNEVDELLLEAADDNVHVDTHREISQYERERLLRIAGLEEKLTSLGLGKNLSCRLQEIYDEDTDEDTDESSHDNSDEDCLVVGSGDEM